MLTTGNFNLAIKALLVKARRALHAIRTRLFKTDIPIRIWTKIFDSVILPIALYGSEIWGPTSNYSHKDWLKHPLEALHVEFCRSILHVHRNTPNNACRAELGRLPLNLERQTARESECERERAREQESESEHERARESENESENERERERERLAQTPFRSSACRVLQKHPSRAQKHTQ